MHVVWNHHITLQTKIILITMLNQKKNYWINQKNQNPTGSNIWYMTSLLQFVAVAEGQEVFLEDGRPFSSSSSGASGSIPCTEEPEKSALLNLQRSQSRGKPKHERSSSMLGGASRCGMHIPSFASPSAPILSWQLHCTGLSCKREFFFPWTLTQG